MDVDLHNAFKAATAARGENMTDVLLAFITDYVALHQHETRKNTKKKERRS